MLPGPTPSPFTGDKAKLVGYVRDAVYASKLVSYAQGYVLMRAAAQEFKWNLNYGGIALMWRGGCIIRYKPCHLLVQLTVVSHYDHRRSKFLGKIKEAFDKNPNLTNLLLDPFFKSKMETVQTGWREVVALAVKAGVTVPAISSALAYYDGLRSKNLPANLLQAQRDFFGAHTYERVDKPRGQFFHTNWTGRGGSTASTTYNV